MLYKTIIVIWSEVNPNPETHAPWSLTDIASEAENGQFYCSSCRTTMVDDPTKDHDWDGTEFFMEEPE